MLTCWHADLLTCRHADVQSCNIRISNQITHFLKTIFQYGCYLVGDCAVKPNQFLAQLDHTNIYWNNTIFFLKMYMVLIKLVYYTWPILVIWFTTKLVKMPPLGSLENKSSRWKNPVLISQNFTGIHLENVLGWLESHGIVSLSKLWSQIIRGQL